MTSMTKFEEINFKDIDGFSEWLDKYEAYDNSPWMEWWDKNYCQKCEAITMPCDEYARIDGWSYSYYYGDIESAYCEIHKKCRYFEDMNEVPSNKEIIKMWLESEIEDETSI